MKKKIIIASSGYKGFIDNFYSDLIIKIINEGYEVVIIENCICNKNNIEHNESVKRYAIRMQRKISIFADLVSIIKLIKILYIEKPHIVHAHSPKAGILCMISSFITGVKCRMYTIHGLPIETQKGVSRILLNITELISCMLSKKIISVSKSLKNKIIEYNLASEQKVVVLGEGTACGIDYNYFIKNNNNKQKGKQARNELGIPKNSVVVGFLGRVTPDKGIEQLVNVFCKIHKKYKNCYLILAGPIDHVRDRISSETLNRIKKNSNIKTEFNYVQPIKYYSAMDVHVLPSLREGFPTNILEAGSMNVPSVASNVTGCLDAVEDGETGYIYNLKSDKDLKEKLELLIINKEKRLIMGENARKLVKNKYAKERLVKRHFELYNKC